MAPRPLRNRLLRRPAPAAPPRLSRPFALALALGLSLLVACEPRDIPQLVSVREITPPVVDVGDVLLVAGQGFPTKKEARVSFRGTLYRGAESPERGFVLDTVGLSQSDTVVEVPLTEGLRARFGGAGDAAAHVTFVGDIDVAFPAITPGALPITGTCKGTRLDVRGPRARRTAEVQRLEEGARVLGLLGIETEQDTPPAGGLLVTKIVSGSVAESGGLAPGDLLVGLDGLTLLDRGDVVPSGKQRFVTLSLRHGGDPHVDERQLSLRGYRAPATTDLLGVALLLAIAAGVVLFFLSPGPSFLAFADRARQGRALATAPGASPLVRLFAAVHAFLRADVHAQSRAPLSRFVPHFAFVVVTAAVATLPFVKQLGTARVDVLTLYGFATLSVALLAFFAGDGRRWTLAVASGALVRIVLLHLPGALALLGVVLVTGSVRVLDIVRSQGAAPWTWLVTRTPLLPFLALALLVAPLVTVGTTPGLLPEADLEETPRSPGMSAVAASLASWVGAHGSAALLAIVFLGGDNVPFVERAVVEAKPVYGVLAALLLLLKTWTVLFVLLAARRTLPKLGAEQAMGPLLRVVLPGSLVGLAGSAGFLAWDPDTFTRRLLAFLTTGLLLAMTLYAVRRTAVRTASRVHGHLSPFI